MQNAAQAYQNVGRQISNPRELEATLLLQAAARLQSVHDSWDEKRTQLDEALLYNRKLWTVFLSEMTDASNPMPKDVRQNVANIGLFVMNHTVTAMTDPNPVHLDSLISINREIAAGLLGRAA
jgi:flagellar protein FlaF